MIVDLDRFVAAERPFWEELDERLLALERAPDGARPLADLERLFDLYERAASGLARLGAFAAPPEMHGYLERLVARAYAEIHSPRRSRGRFSLLEVVSRGFPRAFRRRFAAFLLATATTVAGAGFGAFAVAVDPGAKAAVMPFHHLLGDPASRVREEERRAVEEPLRGARASFSAQLATHNTRVALLSLALGATWGLGTLVLLFYNGVVLGAVLLDYLAAGQGLFLAGWLLPHGVVEIPAFLVAGQAGLVLAAALVGHGSRAPLGARLRGAAPDLAALAVGVAVLLAWAGVVEGMLSQIHEPVLPYAFKIAFGGLEAALLGLWLARGGRGAGREAA